jgi:hypothetical protein
MRAIPVPGAKRVAVSRPWDKTSRCAGKRIVLLTHKRSEDGGLAKSFPAVLSGEQVIVCCGYAADSVLRRGGWGGDGSRVSTAC